MTKIAKARGRSVEEIEVGARFHALIVTGPPVRREGRKGYFIPCICDCGTRTLVYAGHLRGGSTKGCGCLQTGSWNLKHGMSHMPEYRAWDNARSRCYRQNDRKFIDYGGRGIVMCDRWRYSFADFFEDMGRRPSSKHSLDRKDNNGNYEPSNCRWATAQEQNQNRRPMRPRQSPSRGASL